jgi:hypothetical protein
VSDNHPGASGKICRTPFRKSADRHPKNLPAAYSKTSPTFILKISRPFITKNSPAAILKIYRPPTLKNSPTENQPAASQKIRRP